MISDPHADGATTAAASRRTHTKSRSPAARRPDAVPRRGFGARVAIGLLALLLLGWALLPLVQLGNRDLPTQVELVIASASGAVLLVTLGAVVVGTLAARRHAWESVAVAAVAGLMPWVFVIPFAVANQPDQAATGSASEPMPLRVMLVNADQGNASAQDIAATAQATSVDIVVVTELTGTLAHDLTRAGLGRRLTPGWIKLPGEPGVDDNPEAGTGVWASQSTTSALDIPGTRWPAVRLTLDAAGQEVTLVVGHVDSPQTAVADWARDLRLLRESVPSQSPALLVANLNATTWNADFRQFHHSGWQDAADVLGRGPRPTWPTWSLLPVLALDHVMVSSQVGVNDVTTVDIDGSDHRGLVVEVTIPGSTGS